MRNASYVLAATIVATTIAGCGGSSVSHVQNNNSNNGNNGGGLVGPQTNLASTGYIEVSYLTGAGRGVHRDFGDVAMNLTLGDWTDIFGNTVSAPTGTILNLQADAYGGPQVIRTPVTFGASTPDSRQFRDYVLSFNYLSTDQLPGQQILPSQTFVVNNGNMVSDEMTTGQLGDGTTFTAQTYKANVRAFPGRFSSVTVRIDPNTIGLNFQPDTTGVFGAGNPRGIFETTQFNTINFANQNNQEFTSVLSDYLSFDLSHMPSASLPSLTNNGVSVNGQRVFFSGDTYAISDAVNVGNFFQLTKDVGTGGSAFLPGTFNTNGTLNGYPLPGTATAFLPGTYALNEIDPSDPSFLTKILSLEGMFMDYSKMLKPTTNNYVAITFPGSQDNNIQDLVVFKLNSAGQIGDFYYGYVDYEQYEFFLYAINTLVTAVPVPTTNMPLGYFHGKISASTDFTSAGTPTSDEQAVRSGTFKLDTPFTWQDGSNTTFSGGTFIVYRR